MGQRKFYTAKTADRYGLQKRADRCTDCPESEKCPFYMDIAADEKYKPLYVDYEKYDGYYRDKCVFSDDIDIEDTMTVLIDYENGVKLNYSLNSFCPWEGQIYCFTGTKGRLEHQVQEKVYINADGSRPKTLQVISKAMSPLV